MPLFSQTIHRNIYLFGLLLLVFSLPLSMFGTSFSQLIILGNWILEGKFREKFKILKSNKSILFFASIFFIHALWLLPPQDYSYAYNDLKIKVPLLVLPVLIGTSNYLSAKNIKLILIVFVSGVLLGSLISLFRFLFYSSINVTNYRELSVFISHIRFSLMVAFSLFILLYYCFINRELKFNNVHKFIAILISLWLIVLLFLLKSLTGLIVFSVIVYLSMVYRAIIIKSYFKPINKYFLVVTTQLSFDVAKKMTEDILKSKSISFKIFYIIGKCEFSLKRNQKEDYKRIIYEIFYNDYNEIMNIYEFLHNSLKDSNIELEMRHKLDF